ncbi:MAG: hypothetical protein M0Z26_02285 [Acidithiobacillus sp.]|jgi:hypothetical protein|nr:hypothetical protein [Acidithiobacillus sp.]UBU61041.1 hypothetical protein LDB30_07895 [Acidithiobacillus ferrooxidans]
MVVQLPEPDYYELAEVAKRWDVSESYLMRLGAEGKLELAWPIQGSMWVSVTSDSDHPETVEELESLFPSLPPDYLCFRIARKAKNGLEGHESLALANSHARVTHELWRKTKWHKIEISVSGLAIMSRQSLENLDKDSGGLGSTGFTRVSHFTGTENTMFDPPIKRLPWRYEIRESRTSRGGLLPQLPDGYYFEGEPLVTVDELVVLTSEVQRIEGRHKEAEKVVASDVLSTKPKETMQAIIAALAEALAEQRGPRLRNGKNINATAIAEGIADMIPDRKLDTIRKVISTAIDAGLIQRR